jgi:hypothetical protein
MTAARTGVSESRCGTHQNSQAEAETQPSSTHDAFSDQVKRPVLVPDALRYHFTGINATAGKTGQ